MTDPNVKEILTRCIVNGLPNTYILGNNAKRVTFHSQQRRAFNLIWALFEDGRLKAGDRVAIIGGGLAGITAAVAAKYKGCEVTIYELAQTFLPLWRNNSQRYVHPNIYDWPKDGNDIETTSLPALNWHADFAKNIAEQIMEEWDFYSEDIIKKIPYKVKRLQENTDGEVEITTEPFRFGSFNCVVGAVGFGIEETHDVPNAVTYWTGDDIDATPVTTGNYHQNVLITGCGDGGLIDALRNSLVDFDHKSYTDQFLKHPEFELIKDAIIIAEDTFATMDDSRASAAIYQTYQNLITPQLTNLLQASIRKDKKVILNSNGKTPLTKNASVHNRVLVSLLIELNLITFESGKAIDFNLTDDGQYEVVIERSDGTTDPIYVDKVIIRHGPKELITNLFGEHCIIPECKEPDPTSGKLWPDEFYSELPKPTPNQQKYMYNQTGSLLQLIGSDIVRYKVSVGITKLGDQPAYSLSFSADAPENFLEDIKAHKGYPIVLERNQTPIISQSGNNYFEENFREARVVEGMPVANHMSVISGDKKYGTLGCFVSTAYGQLGFISTSHSILSTTYRNSIDVDMLYDRNAVRFMKYVPVGKVKNFSEIRYVHQDGSKRENLFDAGMVIIDTKMNIPVFLEELRIVKTLQIFVGQYVKKLGAGSGETRGQVSAVACRIEVSYDHGTAVFNNVFQVKGLGKPFSTTGDSGSLVTDERGAAMGIVFAGNDAVSYICPIEPILEHFSCRPIKVGQPTTPVPVKPY
jgi:hypothetical protein